MSQFCQIEYVSSDSDVGMTCGEGWTGGQVLQKQMDDNVLG
jgi:hypothetical protein